MPKHEIDYSNTIIYKITCKDSMVSDLYVGHTTNFVQRKHAHKQSCINEKSPNHKCKLYEVIRNNGGWINWKMEIINFFNCKTHYEARKKEQEYFVSLNATLNSIEPYAIPKPREVIEKNKIIKEVLHCKECNKYFNNKDLLETHNKTNKHMKNLEPNKKCKKNAKEFTCEPCNYKCSKESEYKKHLLTLKHINTTNHNTLDITIEKEYICDCGKKYNHRASLFNHKKNCNTDENSKLSELKLFEENSIKKDEKIDLLINEHIEFKNIILDLIKSNTELQKQTMKMHQQMLEVCKNINTTINNNLNNSNNPLHRFDDTLA
jgi:hypothetical protein